MSRGRTLGRRASIAVCIAASCLAGCPVPIAHTEALSAPVEGVLVQADGTPASGAQVAVSTEVSDSSCTRPALTTTTDAMGAFRLPGIQKRHRVRWIIPNLDIRTPRYQLCASIADTLRPAYHGWGSVTGSASPDSVTCQEWAWDNRPRITCSGRRDTRLVTGGRWIAGDASGFFRLILADDATGPRGVETRPRTYLQWIEQSAAGRPLSIRATVLLPTDPKAYGIHTPRLEQRSEGGWCASVRSMRQRPILGAKETLLAFELGPPRQVRPVASCR
jgi:hypothetical protein